MMKKNYLFLLIILIFFNVSCTSNERNKSLINYDSNYTDNFYPNYRNHPQSQYLSKNQNLISYFYFENIKVYKYTLSGNTLKIWIKNFENMPQEQKTKIKNDLTKIYNNIEIVKNEQDIN